MAIEFMGAIGGAYQGWNKDTGGSGNREFQDTDITSVGGAELIDHQFGNLGDSIAQPIDYGFAWSGASPAAYYPMRTGAFDSFDRGGSQDVRYWMIKMIGASQDTSAFVSRFCWFNVKANPEIPTAGDLALQITTDPNNTQVFIRVQWYGTAGAWINTGTQTAAIANDTILRLVVKVDLSGANPVVTIYYGDGTASSMSSVGPDTLNGANDPSVAQVTAQTTPECTVGYLAIGKNQGFGMGFFDYAVADALASDSWNGYAWTSANGGTAVNERAWERVPTGDGDDDEWAANGNAANCTGQHNAVDDEYHDDDGGDGANDRISATATAQQLFTFQGLDGSADADGVAIVVITRDHSKVANYKAHWKDDTDTERQKALVKGYENGTAGTTYFAWIPTRAGTAGVSDWTHARVEAAQFGVEWTKPNGETGVVYGYHILVLGDSLGAQSDIVACPAATAFISQVIGPY